MKQHGFFKSGGIMAQGVITALWLASAIQATAATSEQSTEDAGYAWSTPHFTIHSDVELVARLQGEIGDVLEETFRQCLALPLEVTGSDPHPGRYTIHIVDSNRRFRKMTGESPDRAAGMFLPDDNMVVISGRYFADRPRSFPWARKPAVSFTELHPFAAHVLAHEATHLILAQWSTRMPAWLYEGLAEYVAGMADPACADLRPSEIMGRIVREQSDCEEIIHLANLDGVVGMSQHAWRSPAISNSKAWGHYHAASVLTGYMILLHGTSGLDLEQYIALLQRDGLQAANSRLLRDGPEQLHRSVAMAYADLGIDLAFKALP